MFKAIFDAWMICSLSVLEAETNCLAAVREAKTNRDHLIHQAEAACSKAIHEAAILRISQSIMFHKEHGIYRILKSMPSRLKAKVITTFFLPVRPP